MSRLNRLFTIIIALCLGLSAGYLSYTQLLYIPDQALTNWIYDHAATDSLDYRITIIAIDSKSEAVYGSYETWSRSLLADAVSELSEQDAAVIGLDLNLSLESADSAGDRALAKACADSGNVITIANAIYSMPKQDSNLSTPQEDRAGQVGDALDANVKSQISYVSSDDNWEEQEISGIVYPYTALREGVLIGVANAAQESSDGIIRNAALSVNYEDIFFDSFAVAVYKSFQDYLGASYTLPSLENNELFGFNIFSGQLTNNIVSFSDLLSGNYDPSLIQGSIVLIGEYNQNFTTQVQSFFDPGQVQQEVLIQAAIIQTLLNQDTIRVVPAWLQGILSCLLITILYLILASRRTWVKLLIQFLLAAAFVNIGYVSNLLGYRLQLFVPLLYFVLIIILSLMQHNVLSIIDRKRMEMTLKMYVEPEVVDQLTSKSPRDLARLSERKHVAILFVDIRGFTTLSESLEPEQVVDILNEYLGLVAEAIAYWNGTLDKFIGDAAMAIFNAPSDLDYYILRAVCAADAIAHNSDYIREKYEERYGKTVSFGIGVNCGDAIVGNIGSLNRMDYTAIGDTVNTASRLEANARAEQILVSEEVYEAVKDYVEATYIGPLSLKGKVNAVETYQIDAITNLPAELLPKEGFFLDKFILHPKTRPAR